MHPLFGEWYRKANIEPSGELLAARWKAIGSFNKKLDIHKIAELVRCFVRLPWKNATIQNEFMAEFQTTDAAFPMRENAVELQVLAGAALIALQEQPSEHSDVAACFLVAAAAPGLRKPPIVPEIVVLTEQYLFDRSAAVRRVPTRSRIVGVKHEQLIEAVKTACASNQAVQLAQPLENVLRGIEETINKVAQSTEAALAVSDRAAIVQAEESNIIWWVFGETSRDLGRRFSDVPKGSAAVVAGKELADLIGLIPGPRAARAYLDKILGRSDAKKLAVTEAAREMPEAWLTQLSFEEAILDLCPILYVLHETVQQRIVAESARKALVISASSLTQLETAMQMYRECLAVKLLGRK